MNKILKGNHLKPGVAWLALGLGAALCGWGLLSSGDASRPPATLSRQDDRIVRAEAASAERIGVVDTYIADDPVGFLSRAVALREKIAADREHAEAYAGQIRQLLSEWAQSDPEAALSCSLSSDAEDTVGRVFFQAADAALTAWAKRDLETARAYVEQQAESTRIADELGPALMRACMAADPLKAREWVRSDFTSDSTELRPVVARELVDILHEQGRTEEIETWLADPQVAETAYASPAIQYYAGLLATTDTDAALAFSKMLPRGSTTRNVALEEALHGWAMRDLGRARDWIIAQKTPIDVARPDLFGDVENPQPIPPESYTSGELDYAIAGYVLAVAQTTSPKAVTENLQSIWNPSLRKRLARQVSGLELKPVR